MLKLKKYVYIIAILISLMTFNNAFSSEEIKFNINDYLNEIQSLQAGFKQTIFSSENDVIDYSEGLFLLKKPDKIMWNFKAPSVKKVVVNDQKITTYDADLNQVIIIPFSNRYQSSLANLLLENNSLMNYYQISSETVNENVYSVVLVQKESNNLFIKIQITIVGMLLTKIKLWDTNGQSIDVDFDDTILNSSLSETSFEFSIPNGTDVLDQT
jgi:outer membrane lipoprotein carrier protein